jgi:hypothetical protein
MKRSVGCAAHGCPCSFRASFRASIFSSASAPRASALAPSEAPRGEARLAAWDPFLEQVLSVCLVDFCAYNFPKVGAFVLQQLPDGLPVMVLRDGPFLYSTASARKRLSNRRGSAWI